MERLGEGGEKPKQNMDMSCENKSKLKSEASQKV